MADKSDVVREKRRTRKTLEGALKKLGKTKGIEPVLKRFHRKQLKAALSAQKKVDD
jgi:hypothetical protein